MGNLLKFIPQPVPSPSGSSIFPPYHAFDIEYTLGENLPSSCANVKTSIIFYCNLMAGRGTLELLQNQPCSVQLRWNSSHACPQCQESDVIYETGACVDGQRQVTSRFIRACSDTDTGILPGVSTQTCQNVTVNRFYGLGTVAGVLILLLLGFGLAILFFRQKRELETRYKQLKTDNNLGDSDDEAGLGEMNSDRRDEPSISLEINAEDDDDVQHDIPLEDDDD